MQKCIYGAGNEIASKNVLTNVSKPKVNYLIHELYQLIYEILFEYIL